MKTDVKGLALALATAGALAMAGSLAAQSPTPATTSPETGTMSGHHHVGAKGGHDASAMKADCEAMVAKKQAMQERLLSMDATMDKLLAEMNAAGATNVKDAVEKPMMAVLTELVSQRKEMHAAMVEMQSSMMAHMGRHMKMAGKTGATQSMADCPMTKMSEHEKRD